MISFATLFLGLVFGVQSVELVVADSVAVVDVLVDGQVVETLKGPPWRLQVDLGPELEPHLLEAVAFDALFGELGRTAQRINLPRDPVEVEVAVAETETGRGAVARLSWGSHLSGDPSSIEVTLDGRAVEIGQPGRIELPAYDPELLHLLRVEVEFARGAASTTEAIFGSRWVDRSTFGPTAVAIELLDGKRPGKPGDLRGSFVKAGEPLEVAVLEKEASDIVIVRDHAAEEGLAGLIREPPQVTTEVRSGYLPDVFSDPQSVNESGKRILRDWRAQFFWPLSRPGSGSGGRFDLFQHSATFTEEDADLATLMTGVRAPRSGGEMRLADAVAVAGLTAAAANRRRAVVLVLGDGEWADASDSSPAMARRFLERLRVPFFLWSVSGERPGSEGWSDAIDISSRGKLEKAVRQLHKALEAQRVVWLEGSHLPHEIELSDRARGIRLAGSPSPAA